MSSFSYKVDSFAQALGKALKASPSIDYTDIAATIRYNRNDRFDPETRTEQFLLDKITTTLKHQKLRNDFEFELYKADDYIVVQLQH